MPSASKKHSTRWNTAAYGRLREARHRGTLRTATHRAQLSATSVSAHRRQKQIVPLRARNQAGRIALHALVQLTPALHHENTHRKVEYSHGVRLADHDPDTNLSNLRFADDILPIIGSRKHTTTMLDDLTKTTTAHGLQLHTTKKPKSSPQRHHSAEEATRWQFKE